MNIYLVGYMYSGKTTVGRQLARRLNYRFIDLDQAFESHYRTTVPLFFQRYGEAAFRQLEQKELHLTAELDHTIVSTGGGTPCHADNMDWINAHGTSIFLETTPEELVTRALKSRKQRPVLSGMSPAELDTFITTQLEQRLPYYRKAQLSFPAGDPDIELLADLLASHGITPKTESSNELYGKGCN